MLVKFDEAIAMVQKAEPLNPLSTPWPDCESCERICAR
jgi:hypothetical protein